MSKFYASTREIVARAVSLSSNFRNGKSKRLVCRSHYFMNHQNSCTPLAIISRAMNHFIGPAKQALCIRIMAVTINDIKNLHYFDNKNQSDVSLNCRTQRTVFPMDKYTIFCEMFKINQFGLYFVLLWIFVGRN